MFCNKTQEISLSASTLQRNCVVSGFVVALIAPGCTLAFITPSLNSPAVRITDPYIDPQKLTDYLLNLDHPTGGSKAVLLIAAGFRRENPEVLYRELLRLALTHDCISDPDPAAEADEYLVYGPLYAPTRVLHVKTVWYSPPRPTQSAEAQLHKFVFGTMYKQRRNLI